MEIDDEEMERRSSPPPVKNEVAKKDEPIDPIDPVETVDDLGNVAVSRKRPRWDNKVYKMPRGMKPHMVLPEKLKYLKGSLVM